MFSPPLNLYLAGDGRAGGYARRRNLLKDADGDGRCRTLRRQRPDDPLFDTDGDGLSDFAEAAFEPTCAW